MNVITTVGLAGLITGVVAIALALIAIEELVTHRNRDQGESVWQRVWMKRRHHAGGAVYGAAILLLAFLATAKMDRKLNTEVLIAFAALFLYMLLILRVLNAWPFHNSNADRKPSADAVDSARRIPSHSEHHPIEDDSR